MKCINPGCDGISFAQMQPNLFVKVCLSCDTAQPGRYCWHDTLRCKNACQGDDCYLDIGVIMKRKIHPAPRRGTIPLWKIRRAVRKIKSAFCNPPLCRHGVDWRAIYPCHACERGEP